MQKRCLALVLMVLSASFLSACGGGGGGGGSTTPPTYSLAGQVVVPSNLVMDGDVNDPETPLVRNNDPANAQGIANPSMVLGYLNVAGSGPAGALFVSGDILDCYKVFLSEGQVAEMAIADYQVSDLDLYLADESGETLIDASILVDSQYEAVTAPADGVYLLVASAFSGGSNYSLTVGGTTAASFQPEDDFVPGEVIVQMKPSETPTAARTLNFAEATGLRNLAGRADRPMLMGFADESEQGRAFVALGIHAESMNLTRIDANTARKKATMEVVRALRKRSDVASADLNYIRKALAVPNDQYYYLQWHYPRINLPQAWDSATGAGVIVAVVDTGVDLQHPDLAGQLLPGYDFVSSVYSSNDGDGIDPNPDDPGDRSSPTGESSFHGTHVAGTIGAATNNNIGVAGVAYNSKIIPVRVLGAGSGSSYDVMQGVRYAAGLPNDSNTYPTNRADIINLSLGGSSLSVTEQNLYTDVRNAGVIVVAAAGNYNTSTPFYPASYNGVVSVSALDYQGAKAPYSNYGAYVDVAAPGGDMSADLNADGFIDGVLSTTSKDDGTFSIKFEQGTSMASPHVAGVAALMKEVWPAMTPSDFDALLASGAMTLDLGAPGRDDVYGYGVVNAAAAVAAASEMASTTIPAHLVVSPANLSFGVAGTTATIICSNSGNEALTITSVTDDAAWLTVTPGATVGVYTATVNRTSLANGSYSATITFTSTANTVNVPVTMIVDAAYDGEAKSVGTVWLGIALYSDVIDGGDITVHAVPFAQSTGANAYEILGVPAGEYVLFGGTDIDNDGEMGEDDELFGAYPLLDSPAALDVKANLANLSFSVAPIKSIGGASVDAVAKTRYHMVRGLP